MMNAAGETTGRATCTGRVPVVDDDPQIRDLVVNLLAMAGITAHAALVAYRNSSSCRSGVEAEENA